MRSFDRASPESGRCWRPPLRLLPCSIAMFPDLSSSSASPDYQPPHSLAALSLRLGPVTHVDPFAPLRTLKAQDASLADDDLGRPAHRERAGANRLPCLLLPSLGSILPSESANDQEAHYGEARQRRGGDPVHTRQ